MQSTGATLLNLHTGGAIDGFTFVNLELEYIGAAEAPQVAAAADGVSTSHGLILNCTGASFNEHGRRLACYNHTTDSLSTTR